MAKTDQTQLKSLSRAIEIINLLEENFSLSAYKISDLLNIPRSTAYKYIAQLREHGFISYDEQTEKYKLGFRLYILGSHVESQLKIDKIARPFMEELVECVKETVAINVLNNDVGVNVERVGVESQSGIVYYMKKGAHIPLHAGAAGKILLAFQPEDKIRQFIKNNKLKKFTDRTITNPDKLIKQLEEIRKIGVAYSNQEIVIGARAVAAPIYNIHGKVVAGLVVVGPVQRMNVEKVTTIKNLVIKYAQKISDQFPITNFNE